MKRFVIILLLSFSACAGPKNVYDASNIGDNYATLQGGPVRAAGGVASLGGAFDTNGYIEVRAVDDKYVSGNDAGMSGAANFMSKVLLGAAGGNITTPEIQPVRIAPGRHEIKIRIVHGAVSSTHKFFMTAEPKRQYFIKSVGDGYRGSFWVEDDLGQKTQKQQFRIVLR